ncbi:formate dehydrogenase accessory sulfurtransferase FdhD [Rhodococcus artemisiae]|uniref:Sulfur carrier protein FdhD n=1 Tax=Rhodococcus artemisiae TaxID=714159 RepID=A0ABU7L4X6_9NOCA|nr:formate dehydrogenase accessory sulfurtransferase FdhD [Rhodococcus artemisiae]MEE2056595.1 formate dehydrogenase accessory sulfurtransferase FdhD [Rhodococcus artemisiae]
MGRVTTRRAVLRITADRTTRRPDTLAVEEPLELRLDGQALTVTMRTPGNDVELAHGFLLAEGIIGSRDDIAIARYCDGVDDTGANTYNVLDIQLAPGVAVPDGAGARNFLTTSACGVCGKESLDQVRTRTRFPLRGDVEISARTLSELPHLMHRQQKVFHSTGGLHAAALFTIDGSLVQLREDVGRHNAVDKVLGWALSEGRVPLSDSVLVVSGRASFELVQKAVMAGVPALGAVSAPSSLAVDLAEESGLTLIGFLRDDSMNVYTGSVL